VVVVCQSRFAAAGLELRFFIMKGDKERKTMTHLLFGPRQFAFELLVLIHEDLVLIAQRCKALGELVGELGHVAVRVLRHGSARQRAMSNEQRAARTAALRHSKR